MLAERHREGFGESGKKASGTKPGRKEAQKVILNLCKELAKRNEFQNVLYSHDEIDEIIKSENQIIKKITKQILYRLERSTSHVE